MKLKSVFLKSLFGIALASWAFAQPTRASELFDRPIFTPERNFVIEAPQSATRIQDASLPVSMLIFDQAMQTCKLSADDVQGRFGMILDPTSALWTTLDLLFPGSINRIKTKKITVLIDDFSSFAGNHPEYASYFIQSDSNQTDNQLIIGLDCSSEVARDYWLPSLTHEFTHAILSDQAEDSWWEEGLAQLMENKVGGAQPDLTLRHLEVASQIPVLLETRRPLPSRESYAMTYLFAGYVKDMFGGWPLLSAMTLKSDHSNSCESISDFLSRIACRGQNYLGKPGMAQQAFVPLGPDKMTRNGLLRYFYVALTMKNASVPEYQISGWDGFTETSSSANLQSLLPGQASVCKNEPQTTPTNSSLEMYRVLVDAQGNFKILPKESGWAIPQNFQAQQDYFLFLDLN